MTRSPRRRGGLLALAAVALLGVLLPAAPAAALPPDGAGADTPGTSSSVSPGTLQPCQTIGFTVSGFPAGEIVYIKIDDGVGYGDTSIQGTGVVAKQAIPASGTVNGSFELPCDIAPGAHWLRYLASELVDPDNPGAGTIGYTNRGSSDFTVVAASGGSDGGGATGGDSSSSGLGGSVPAAGTTVGEGSEQVGGQGGTLTIDPDAVAAESTPAPTSTPSPTASPRPSASAAAASDEQPASASVPWTGIIVLVVLLLVGAVVVWLVLRRRRPVS